MIVYRKRRMDKFSIIFTCIIVLVCVFQFLNSAKTWRIECNRKANNCVMYKTTHINNKEQKYGEFAFSDIEQVYFEKKYSSKKGGGKRVSCNCDLKLKNGKLIFLNHVKNIEGCQLIHKQIESRLKKIPFSEYGNIYEVK